jgi:hypothetical protein
MGDPRVAHFFRRSEMLLHEPIGSWCCACAPQHLKYSIPRMGNSRKAIRAIDPEDSTIQAAYNKATSSAREKQ